MVGKSSPAFLKQLDKLKEFPLRLLVIEGSVSDLSKKPRFSGMSWPMVAARLMRWTANRGIPIWMLGPRTSASVRMLEQLFVGIYDSHVRDEDFPSKWMTEAGIGGAK
jgi:hypothetical protein